MMTNTVATTPRALTVVGFYPSGTPVSESLVVQSPLEASIRVMAGRRYSEDGGDLHVSCVIDDASGDVVAETVDAQLLSEVDAVDEMLHQVAGIIDSEHTFFAAELDPGKVRVFVDFFNHVLAEQPDVFHDLAGGVSNVDGEDMEVEFEDRLGRVHTFVPSTALLYLAEVALQKQHSIAALQIRCLVQVAGSTFDLAVADAFGDY